MPTIRIHISEASPRFRKMLKDVRAAAPVIAKRLCREVITFAVQNLDGEQLQKHTGEMMRYVGTTLSPMAVSDGWAIGLPAGELMARIARVHETGATIKAKSWFTKSGAGPFLVFPKPGGPGLTATGRVSKAKGAPSVELIFAKQVTLPSRPWFSSAIHKAIDRLPATIDEVMQQVTSGDGVGDE